MYNVQCIMYNVLCTMYYVLCTMYYVLCTMYYVQCTMYDVLYNVQDTGSSRHAFGASLSLSRPLSALCRHYLDTKRHDRTQRHRQIRVSNAQRPLGLLYWLSLLSITYPIPYPRARISTTSLFYNSSPDISPFLSPSPFSDIAYF